MNEQENYVIGTSKPRCLCRWWMRVRRIEGDRTINIEGKTWLLPLHELYCPAWARPLDILWKLIFGNPFLKRD